MPRLFKNLQINDVSSVNRGAGVGVKVMLMKRDDSDEIDKREFSQGERDKAADSGAALPDGSFPIKNVSDLHNAIKAVGRAKDRGRAMAHIKSRAKALGASDALPDSWSKRDDDEDNVIDMTGLIGKKETDMSAEQIKKVIDDAVSAAMKDATDRITKAESEATALRDQVAFLSMPVAHQEFCKDMTVEQKKAFSAKDKKEQDEEMAELKDEEAKEQKKRLDPAIAKRLAEAEDDRKILKALQLKDEQATFAKRAVELGLTEDKGEVLRKAQHGDVEAFSTVEKLIGEMTTALKAAQKDGKIFKEFGSGQEKSGATALDQIESRANDLLKSPEGKGLTKQQAFAKVYADPENAELVRMEKSERYKTAGVAA